MNVPPSHLEQATLKTRLTTVEFKNSYIFSGQRYTPGHASGLRACKKRRMAICQSIYLSSENLWYKICLSSARCDVSTCKSHWGIFLPQILSAALWMCINYYNPLLQQPVAQLNCKVLKNMFVCFQSSANCGYLMRDSEQSLFHIHLLHVTQHPIHHIHLCHILLQSTFSSLKSPIAYSLILQKLLHISEHYFAFMNSPTSIL